MDKGNKEKIVVPIVCLLLSISMWFYVITIENPQTKRSLDAIPVTLQNIEKITNEGLAITPGQKFEVTLKLTGGVKDVESIKKDSIKIVADFEKYPLTEGKNTIPAKIQSFPTENVVVENASTLFIEIDLEPLVEKEFKVAPNVETNVTGSLVATESVKPDIVKVFGAKSAIDSIVKVEAYGKEDEIKESMVKKYPIRAVNKNGEVIQNLTYSQDQVEIEIKVAEAISKSVPIKIKTTGSLPSGLTLKSITGNVESVEIKGAAADVEKIGYLETEPIDLSVINESKDLKVVIYQPDEVKIVEGSEYLQVKIVLSKSISKDFTVKYSVIGLENDLEAKYSKDTVIVTISGNEDDIANIKAENIKVTLDLSSHNQEGTFNVKPVVTVQGLPNGSSAVAGEVSVTLSKITNGESS